MKITIYLPVSFAIKKFLTQKFGEEYELNQSEWLGILVSSLLSKKNSNWENRFQHCNVGEVYKFTMKLSYADKHGIMISPTQEYLLRKSLENIFRENLYEQAIINKSLYDIDYKTTIENLLEFYGIVEEDKCYYQSLIRDFNRKKDHILKGLS